MYDIALVTCPSFAHYHDEDIALIKALENLGLSTQPYIWPSPDPDYSVPPQAPPERAYFFRSTWDYHFYPQAFADWLRSLQGKVWNSTPLMLWNMHKGYLLDLESRGASIVPTKLVRQSEPLGTSKWPKAQQLIAKPAISAGARDTLAGTWEELEQHCNQVLLKGDLLIQPYLSSVSGYGERSLLFVEGKFTHAVLRNQPLVEGPGLENTRPLVDPSDAELATALKILQTLPEVPLYARIDLLLDDEEVPCLLELEVIEPRLFLQESPVAVAALAQACARRLT